MDEKNINLQIALIIIWIYHLLAGLQRDISNTFMLIAIIRSAYKNLITLDREKTALLKD